MSVYPNPAKAVTCIPLSAEHSFKGKLSMQNVLGQEVALIHKGEFVRGQKNFFIHANMYPKGIYFILLECENKVFKKKMIIH